MSLTMTEVETSQLMSSSTRFVLSDLRIKLTKFLQSSTTQDTQGIWTLEHSLVFLASMEIQTVNLTSSKSLRNLIRTEKEFSELLSLKRLLLVLENILVKHKLTKSFNMPIKTEMEESTLRNSHQLLPKSIQKFDPSETFIILKFCLFLYKINLIIFPASNHQGFSSTLL